MSNLSFISEDVLNEYEVPSMQIRLGLTTIHGEATVPSRKTEGSLLESMAGKKIALPNVYSRGVIPFERSLIPDPDPYSSKSVDLVHPTF